MLETRKVSSLGIKYMCAGRLGLKFYREVGPWSSSVCWTVSTFFPRLELQVPKHGRSYKVSGPWRGRVSEYIR